MTIRKSARKPAKPARKAASRNPPRSAPDDDIECAISPDEPQRRVFEIPYDPFEWNTKQDLVRGLGPATERLARMICDAVVGEDSADLLSPTKELRRAADGNVVLKYGELAPLWWKYEPAAKRVIEYYKQLLGA